MTTDTAPAYDELTPSLWGELITPGHPEYDEARKVYNGMIDRHPAAIVRCRDAADVRACVNFAREHSIELAVRGGGHNAGGLGVWDDAIVIDLSPMHSVSVSPADGTVRVDGGCRWADVDHATVAFGMVTSFVFRCHPVGENGVIFGGPVLYDIADTAEVMRWYRDALPSFPEDLSGWIGLLTIPPA